MKSHTPAGRVAKTGSSTGRNAVALAPPGYGIDLIDRRTFGVVQRQEIDTRTDDKEWKVAGAFPTKDNDFQGLEPRKKPAKKTVTKVEKTTAAADPDGMATWKAKNYLVDPSKPNRNQALTRMHAIRGRFGGPSQANNMFLGTALSNNFHEQSHYRLVEKPLEDFIQGGGQAEKRAFIYTVDPSFGDVPGYMYDRMQSEVKDSDYKGFAQFAARAIPRNFVCTAELFRLRSGTTWRKKSETTVKADVGAPGSDAKATPQQIQIADDNSREVKAAREARDTGTSWRRTGGRLGRIGAVALVGAAAATGGLAAAVGLGGAAVASYFGGGRAGQAAGERVGRRRGAAEAESD